jgi:hypothetical protein
MVNKLTALKGNRSFIYVFIKARAINCAVQPLTPNLTFLRSSFRLSCHLCLESPGGLFAGNVRALIICSMRAKYAAYIILLALITQIIMLGE